MGFRNEGVLERGVGEGGWRRVGEGVGEGLGMGLEKGWGGLGILHTSKTRFGKPPLRFSRVVENSPSYRPKMRK